MRCVFFCTFDFEASMVISNNRTYLLCVIVLRFGNKLFSQGWAKWIAAQALPHFLVFFFSCPGAATCDSPPHHLSHFFVKRQALLH